MRNKHNKSIIKRKGKEINLVFLCHIKLEDELLDLLEETIVAAFFL
jgi:hypothetical protein